MWSSSWILRSWWAILTSFPRITALIVHPFGNFISSIPWPIILGVVSASPETTPQIIGQGIEDIKLPNGCTISAVIRGKEVKIAHHDVKIHEDDHIIIFLSDKKLFPALETSLMS